MTSTRAHREPKPEKKSAVADLADRFKRAEVIIIAESRGVTVDKVTQLRADLRKSKSELKVVKNTLAKRALVGTRYESLKDKFKGPIAIAISYADVVSPAKALDQFAKDNEGKGLKIIGGGMGSKVLSVEEVKELASLPTMEVARSMLLGMFMQPAAGMARLLDAYAKKLGGGESTEAKPAEPAPAAPAPTT
jgi:large subunit ribosomal protein L10